MQVEGCTHRLSDKPMDDGICRLIGRSRATLGTSGDMEPLVGHSRDICVGAHRTFCKKVAHACSTLPY